MSYSSSTATRRITRSQASNTRLTDVAHSAPGYPAHENIRHPRGSQNAKRHKTTTIGDWTSNSLNIQGTYERDVHSTSDDKDDLEFPITYSGIGVLAFKNAVKIPAIKGDTVINGSLKVEGGITTGDSPSTILYYQSGQVNTSGIQLGAHNGAAFTNLYTISGGHIEYEIVKADTNADYICRGKITLEWSAKATPTGVTAPVRLEGLPVLKRDTPDAFFNCQGWGVIPVGTGETVVARMVANTDSNPELLTFYSLLGDEAPVAADQLIDNIHFSETGSVYIPFSYLVFEDSI